MPTRLLRLLVLIPLAVLLAQGCSARRGAVRPDLPDETVLDPTERYLILSGEAGQPMELVLDSSEAGDALLRTPSRPLDLDDPATHHLADRMLATVQEAGGVGIAAVQVGVPRMLLWAQRFDLDGNPFHAFVNPEVFDTDGETAEGWEGCLSVSDVYSLVERAVSISLRYRTLDGEELTETVGGFTAVILQHELDHLDGVLFTDRADQEGFITREEYLEIKRARESEPESETESELDSEPDSEPEPEPESESEIP